MRKELRMDGVGEAGKMCEQGLYAIGFLICSHWISSGGPAAVARGFE